MDKVPVGKTISHAYQFLFGRFFQILGTAWLPALLYAGVVYVCAQTSVTWLAPLTKDSNLLTHGVLVTAGCVIVALVLRAVIDISLTQEALGVRKDLALAHLVVGPRELRLVFALIRLAIVIAILALVVSAALTYGLKAANQYGPKLLPAPLILGKPPVVFGAIVLAVLIYITYVLSILRLSFLLVPVAAVEKQARIARAWALSGGSAIRIFLVLVGTFLPVAIIGGIAMYLLVGPAHAAAVHPGGAADAIARLHTLLQFYADHATTLAIVSGIAAIVVGALMAGASASAYRTITGHEEEETEDDDALVAPLVAPGHGHDDHGHDDHGHDDHGQGDDHGHGGHDDHGGGHDDDQGHGGGHDDHGDDHGHDDHGGHDDHASGHGDDHGHGGGHDDHGDDHGHGGHGHDDHGHGGGHDDHGGGHGDDHSHGGGHDDHGHGGHDDHGHGHGDGHHHHAKAA